MRRGWVVPESAVLSAGMQYLFGKVVDSVQVGLCAVGRLSVRGLNESQLRVGSNSSGRWPRLGSPWGTWSQPA